MTDTIHTDTRNPVVARIATVVGYRGTKAQIRTADSVTLSGTYWDGGSRSTYSAVNLATMERRELPHFNPPQFGGPREDPTVQLGDGLAIVEHVIFCGKDLGIRIYLHPSNLNPSMLPLRVELTADEAAVLEYTCGRKASYNGRNRFQMWNDDHRDNQMSRERWDAASESLKARKLLNKAGAVTPDGRNARVRA